MGRNWAGEILNGDGEVIQAQAAAPQSRDWAGEVLGGTPTPKSPQPKQEQGNFISRIGDAIKGKRDPRYADVPAFDIDAAGLPVIASTAVAALGGADDKGYADVIQKSLGERFRNRVRDANDYEIIEYVDDKGQTKRGYVNTPGLDMGDVQRGVMGALKYVGAGRAVGALTGGAPLVARMASQAVGQGLTSAAGDAASMSVGSKQGVNLTNALTAAGGGGLVRRPSKPRYHARHRGSGWRWRDNGWQ